MVTSRAVVGSSAMSSWGWQMRPMAIITRWRMPPESSWGYCFMRFWTLLMPTISSMAMARLRGVLRGDGLVVGPEGLDQLVADGVHRV